MRRIVIAKMLILALWGLYLVIGLTDHSPVLAPTITAKLETCQLISPRDP